MSQPDTTPTPTPADDPATLLYDALVEFGGHKETCPAWSWSGQNEPCDCGWEERMAEAEAAYRLLAAAPTLRAAAEAAIECLYTSIECEDGLDGRRGQRVIHALRAALDATPPEPPRPVQPPLTEREQEELPL